jgi:hypothetical protein
LGHIRESEESPKAKAVAFRARCRAVAGHFMVVAAAVVAVAALTEAVVAEGVVTAAAVGAADEEFVEHLNSLAWVAKKLSLNSKRSSKIAGTGNSPLPVGDPPTETARRCFFEVKQWSK